MNIMIKLFLLAYVLAAVLITILGVIWIISAIVRLEWTTRKALLKYHRSKGIKFPQRKSA
jgi:hypothetical protein